MKVLAIDSSLRSSGFAVLLAHGERLEALAHGTIFCASALPLSECLVRIRQKLLVLIDEFSPECCALEGVIYVQSHRTAIALGAARGVAILTAAEKGLETFEYAPSKVKQAVVGKGAAGKHQVAFMVRVLLGLNENPMPDAADALAVGITHIRASRAIAKGGRLGLNRL